MLRTSLWRCICKKISIFTDHLILISYCMTAGKLLSCTILVFVQSDALCAPGLSCLTVAACFQSWLGLEEVVRCICLFVFFIPHDQEHDSFLVHSHGFINHLPTPCNLPLRHVRSSGSSAIWLRTSSWISFWLKVEERNPPQLNSEQLSLNETLCCSACLHS